MTLRRTSVSEIVYALQTMLRSAGWIVTDPESRKDSAELAVEKFEAAGHQLADLGWAIPMSSNPREIDEILSMRTSAKIDRAFVKYYEANRRREFHLLVRRMSGKAVLRQWRPLILQRAAAYKRGHFAITVPSLLTVIEGAIMGSDARLKPLEVLNERIAKFTVRTSGRRGSVTLALWRMTRRFIENLYAPSQFGGPKPSAVNRHWILHGRDVVDWNRAGCLRLFQAVDTVSSLHD